MEMNIITALWAQLVLPLLRILLLVGLGLLLANFIEAMNWTRRLAFVARPLVRLGRLSNVSGASFSMAFFSGVSANTMLAEAFDQGRIEKKELVLANLFNSLPRFFLHLPTVFFLTVPLIKGAALVYVGLTFSAALLQTFLVVVGGRLLLQRAVINGEPLAEQTVSKISWRTALEKSKKRFRQRIPKIALFVVPVYTLFFFLNHYGIFAHIEEYIGANIWFLSWLHPQSLGIVILHVTAEFSAGLAAAGVLLADDSLGYREVVLALMAGNILAAPVRAFRHQFPYYVGIFSPKLALELVGLSQLTRLISLVLVGCGYYMVTL